MKWINFSEITVIVCHTMTMSSKETVIALKGHFKNL